MNMGDIVSIVGQIATPIAIIGGGVALYFSLRRPIDRLEVKFDEKFDRLEAKFDEKLDRVESKLEGRIDRLDEKLSHEVSEFRLEAQTLLARHDERLAAIERRGPQLQLR